MKTPHIGISAVCVRGDDRVLMSCGWDGRVRLFDWRRRAPLAVLPVHDGSAYCGAFMDGVGGPAVLGTDGVFASGGKDTHIVVQAMFPREDVEA